MLLSWGGRKRGELAVSWARRCVLGAGAVVLCGAVMLLWGCRAAVVLSCWRGDGCGAVWCCRGAGCGDVVLLWWCCGAVVLWLWGCGGCAMVVPCRCRGCAVVFLRCSCSARYTLPSPRHSTMVCLQSFAYKHIRPHNRTFYLGFLFLLIQPH